MRPLATIAYLLICLLVLPGCYTFSTSYIAPTSTLERIRPVDVDKPLDSAWTTLIHGLAISSFDIVTMDRQSGFVSATCTGDPEEYVDGGEVVFVATSRTAGGRKDTVRYHAARAETSWTVQALGNSFRADRQVYLDGKVNIILQEAGAHRSRMTVNVRYTVTINESRQPPDGEVERTQDVVTFNTGQAGRTPSGVIFQPTGRLEEAIVGLLR